MNNTFRLFVSSTFSDFIKERSILNNEIFEKIPSLHKRSTAGHTTLGHKTACRHDVQMASDGQTEKSRLHIVSSVPHIGVWTARNRTEKDRRCISAVLTYFFAEKIVKSPTLPLGPRISQNFENSS